MAKSKLKKDEGVLRQASGDGWQLYNADCIELMANHLPAECVDVLITSIPFLSLYVYSASSRDVGNCRTEEEFYEGMRHWAEGVYRVMKPGCIASIHSMLVPTSKAHHGYIGLIDLPGEMTRIMKEAGFIFHSEVVIRKDPVQAMQRTKALGLLHKQLAKDSSMSRQGCPDYVTSFRKPGERAEPIAGLLDHYVGTNPASKEGNPTRDSINVWQRYAEPTYLDIETRFNKILPTLNPEQAELFYQLLNYQTSGTHQQIWDDINPSDTLQYQSARANNDDRHCCPLQLQVIHRCLQLWSNPGDVAFDPFNGIASTGYEAIKMGRKYIGIELKDSYFDCSINNLELAVAESSQLSLAI